MVRTKQILMEYSKFYAYFKLLPKTGDEEDIKNELVSSISQGRTTSLRELSRAEYDLLLVKLDQMVWEQRKMLRKQRSVVLRLMTAIGLDTSEWANIDNFCRQPRIAGKFFRFLDYQELVALERKLRAIKSKRPSHSSDQPTANVLVLPQGLNINQLPS